MPLLDAPFYFLRHGESEANAAGLIAGSTDTPLTALGRDQAERAAAVLAPCSIASIFSSPLRRAADTAETVGRHCGLPLGYLDELRERHWGVLESQPLEEIRDRSATALRGESLVAFEERTWTALCRIDAPPPVLVVAHSGTMRVLRNKLGIGDVKDWVGNALPIRFLPPRPGQPWRFEELGG